MDGMERRKVRERGRVIISILYARFCGWCRVVGCLPSMVVEAAACFFYCVFMEVRHGVVKVCEAGRVSGIRLV